MNEWMSLSSFQGTDNSLLILSNKIKTDSYLGNYNKSGIKLKSKPDKRQKKNHTPISFFIINITTAAIVVNIFSISWVLNITSNALLYS